MNIEIRDVVNKTFDVLDKQLKSYVIMNKYDEIPDRLPSDIDIAISTEDFSRLDYIIKHVSIETGLVITQKIWHNYYKCAYILTPLHVKERFRLQLDFFSDFSVKGTPLLIKAEELQSRVRKYGRFTIPNYDIEFVFLFMRRVFKNDFDAEHCEVLRDVLINDVCGITEYSKKYFPSNLIEQAVGYLLKEEVEKIQSLRGQLWDALRKLSSKNSFGIYGIKYWLNQLKRLEYRCRYPVGMSIAFLSPDGGGKSTIISSILETCWGSFHYIDVKHFRPRLFKNLGHYNILNPNEEISINTNPHGVKPDGQIKSFIRFMFYNLDFFVGGIRVKKDAIKKKLTIFDRYYYDYYVDIKRYKYSFSKKLPYYFQWMIPNPDLVFLLDGSAKLLYERKNELELWELERQIEAYKSISSRIHNGRVINVNQSIEEVVDDVTSEILLYKAQKTAQAMGIHIDPHTGVAVET